MVGVRFGTAGFAELDRALDTDPGMFDKRRRKFLPTESFNSCGAWMFELDVASTSGIGCTTPLARLAEGDLAGAFELPGKMKEVVLFGVSTFFDFDD
jgi:hypothetical protein